MAVQIQIRRDSAADWTSNDPTLAQGELGYETDTGKWKIGDGSTAWTALGYQISGQEALEDIVGAMFSGNTETGITITYQDADGTIDAELDFGIADDKVVQVDGSPNADEVAIWTAGGIKGLAEAAFKTLMNLEIGTDVLAQQTIGIADDNLLEVDDAGPPASGEFAQFTANGLKGLSEAELKAAANLEDSDIEALIDDRDREFEIILVDEDTALSVGDGQADFKFVVPQEINGYNLKSAHAFVYTASSSGVITVQVRNVTDAVDMLSTAITIDANEKNSYTAATPPVVDTSNDDVATGDEIAIDLDGVGTGSQGLGVILVFEKP